MMSPIRHRSAPPVADLGGESAELSAEARAPVSGNSIGEHPDTSGGHVRAAVHTCVPIKLHASPAPYLIEHVVEEARHVPSAENELAVQQTVSRLARGLADERTSVACRQIELRRALTVALDARWVIRADIRVPQGGQQQREDLFGLAQPNESAKRPLRIPSSCIDQDARGAVRSIRVGVDTFLKRR